MEDTDDGQSEGDGPPRTARPAPVSSPPSFPSNFGKGLAGKDFLFIKIVARLALSVLRRFWALTSVCLLSLLLLYWLLGGVPAFMLLSAGVLGALYQAGDRLLYHPDQPPTSRLFVPAPSVVGLPFESIFLKSRDNVRLHAFLIKQREESAAKEAPTVLYLHGNAGNIGHRLLNLKGLYSQLGVNICALEYRYASSQPAGRNCSQHAICFFQRLRPLGRQPLRRRLLLGRPDGPGLSLGLVLSKRVR